MKGYIPDKVNWLSSMSHVRRTVTLYSNGARLVRTASVIEGVEISSHYDFTPGNPLPISLHAYANRTR